MSFEELSQNVGKKNAERKQVVRDDKLTNRPKVSSSGDPHSLRKDFECFIVIFSLPRSKLVAKTQRWNMAVRSMAITVKRW